MLNRSNQDLIVQVKRKEMKEFDQRSCSSNNDLKSAKSSSIEFYLLEEKEKKFDWIELIFDINLERLPSTLVQSDIRYSTANYNTISDIRIF